jgi:cell wall assembly regulator SMI1
MLEEMWREIKAKKDAAQKPCYWKNGFVPLLEDQNFGLLVVDTQGYFGGNAGQLIYFDYKCANGYTVVYENIARWLETNIALLERGIFFKAETYAETKARVQISTAINSGYTQRFRNPIKLANS